MGENHSSEQPGPSFDLNSRVDLLPMTRANAADPIWKKFDVLLTDEERECLVGEFNIHLRVRELTRAMNGEKQDKATERLWEHFVEHSAREYRLACCFPLIFFFFFCLLEE